jgi:hypothetical protein
MKNSILVLVITVMFGLSACTVNNSYNLQYVSGAFFADQVNTAYGDIIELDGNGRARITSNTGFVNFDNYFINPNSMVISFQHLGEARFMNTSGNTIHFRIVETRPNYNYTDHNGDGYDDYTHQIIQYYVDVYRDLYYQK